MPRRPAYRTGRHKVTKKTPNDFDPYKKITMNYQPLSEEEENIGKAIVAAAFKVHKELGPGLLEKVYEI